jgi:hypothetical protein
MSERIGMSGENLIDILENRNRIRIRKTDEEDEFFPNSDVSGEFLLLIWIVDVKRETRFFFSSYLLTRLNNFGILAFNDC